MKVGMERGRNFFWAGAANRPWGRGASFLGLYRDFGARLRLRDRRLEAGPRAKIDMPLMFRRKTTSVVPGTSNNKKKKAWMEVHLREVSLSGGDGRKTFLREGQFRATASADPQISNGAGAAICKGLGGKYHPVTHHQRAFRGRRNIFPGGESVHFFHFGSTSGKGGLTQKQNFEMGISNRFALASEKGGGTGGRWGIAGGDVIVFWGGLVPPPPPRGGRPGLGCLAG